MQIHPGHAICEGRKPALMDSLFQVGGGGVHRVILALASTAGVYSIAVCTQVMQLTSARPEWPWHATITAAHVGAWRHL